MKLSDLDKAVWFKGTVIQIEKALIKMIAYVFQKYSENFAFQLFIILQ